MKIDLQLDGISLFSSAGIGELYLESIGVKIKIANELIEKRAECYKYFYPNTNMLVGDIKHEKIKSKIKEEIGNKIKLLIATPPCQGLSTLGKNKLQVHYQDDPRNYLIFDTFEIIDSGDFDVILIENVPRFLKMFFPYNNDFHLLEYIIRDKYSNKYNIDVSVLDAKDYGIPQTRPRAIIKLYKPNYSWINPKKEKSISLREAIGHLPSLESGERSKILWHYAKKHNPRAVIALKHTPTGKSALQNIKYYPKKEDGTKIKGFHNTFKRMVWDQPAHARTTFCGSISSHNNVHPGRENKDGTFSDARVLTPLELFIVSSIDPKINFPKNVNDSFLYQIIGESIPPLMLKKIMSTIKKIKI